MNENINNESSWKDNDATAFFISNPSSLSTAAGTAVVAATNRLFCVVDNKSYHDAIVSPYTPPNTFTTTKVAGIIVACVIPTYDLTLGLRVVDIRVLTSGQSVFGLTTGSTGEKQSGREVLVLESPVVGAVSPSVVTLSSITGMYPSFISFHFISSSYVIFLFYCIALFVYVKMMCRLLCLVPSL
jgi:hypothetical protein